jgi:hypothetical protein
LFPTKFGLDVRRRIIIRGNRLLPPARSPHTFEI